MANLTSTIRVALTRTIAVRSSAQPPAPVVVGVRPPAPVIVGAGPAAARRLVAVQPPRTAALLPFTGRQQVHTYKRQGGRLVPLAPGLGQDASPIVRRLDAALSAGNATLDMACDAAGPFLAWAETGALYAYEAGKNPGVFWGPALAQELAHKALIAGGCLKLREAINAGRWSWVLEGDTLTAWDVVALSSRSVPSLGWVPDGYITGSRDRRAGLMDRIGFAFGVMGLSTVIAGGAAAAEAAVASGAASSMDEAIAAVNAAAPQAIRGAGAGVSAAAAAAAARQSFSTFKALIDSRALSSLIKWTALAIGGTITAGYLPDAINAFRGANTRATEAAVNGAGAVIKEGIDTGNPDLIEKGLEAMKGYQKQASEGDKYLWAAGGFVASQVLARR